MRRNAPTNSLNTKWLDNIRDFDAKNKLKTNIMTFIAVQVLNSQEQAELRKTFSAMDSDGDGMLNKEEIIEGYYKACGDLEKAEQFAVGLFENIDTNKSGKIDYTGIILFYFFFK
eukprot:TRINITY_DN498_c1_g2_i2.p2 TRINITY_DN498_c1_g2~~TRINITY_DN498_c1_g2_i2.p2  ORF type:complete len:115 (+),score=21.39 TRINITY_DN498_c1_g2_i2:236-580(+)